MSDTLGDVNEKLAERFACVSGQSEVVWERMVESKRCSKRRQTV